MTQAPRHPYDNLEELGQELYKVVFKEYARWSAWKLNNVPSIEPPLNGVIEDKLEQMQSDYRLRCGMPTPPITYDLEPSMRFKKQREVRHSQITRNEVEHWDVKCIHILIRIVMKIHNAHMKVWKLNKNCRKIPYGEILKDISDLSLLNKIHNYFMGLISIDDLGITANNASEYLTYIKLFDWTIAFQYFLGLNTRCWKTSFELKTKILQLCPNLFSWEVYLKTLIPEKMRELPTWLDTHNWPSEHMALKAKTVANQYIMTRSLAERLNSADSSGQIIAVRGNTGSGKSTFMQKCAGFLMKGVLNPDSIKFILKRGVLRNIQIHEEVSAFFFDRFFKEIAERANLSFILDTRLINTAHVSEYLINPAKLRNCNAKLVDIDVSILSSINRVLTRDPRGEDPCPSLKAIKDGYIGIRSERAGVMDLIKREDIVKEYFLYDGPRLRLAAQKIHGVFMKVHPKHLKNAFGSLQ